MDGLIVQRGPSLFRPRCGLCRFHLHRWLLALTFLPATLLPQICKAQSDSIQFVEASPQIRTLYPAEMVQDQFGFIWFNTTSYLYRYDGNSFSIVQGEFGGTGERPEWGYKGLSGGRGGFLCLRPAANAVLLYDIAQNSMLLVPLDREHPAEHREITCGIEDSRGRFWIGTAEGLLYRLTPDPLAVDLIQPEAFGSTATFPAIQAIAQGSQGEIWVGTDRGVYRVAGGLTASPGPARCDIVPGVPDGVVSALLAGRENRLWTVFRDGRVGWLDAIRGTFHSLPSVRLTKELRQTAVVEYPNGDLWIGSFSCGLQRWNARTCQWERYHTYKHRDGGDYSEGIRSLLVDSSGVLWVITASQGILRAIPRRHAFHSYTTSAGSSPSLSGDDILSLRVDHTGTLWVGRQTGGLDVLAPGSRRFRRLVHDPNKSKSLSDNFIVCMHELRDGELWMGHTPGGISVLDRASMTFSRLAHQPGDPTSLGSDTVTVIYQDSHGIVWVGHFQGIDRCDPRTRTFTPVVRWPKESLGLAGTAAAMCEDTKGNLWVGTALRGLLRIHLESGDTAWYRRIPKDSSSLPNNYVGGLCVDAEGGLWVGSGAGLSLFDHETGTFATYELLLPRRTDFLDPPNRSPVGRQEIKAIVAGRTGELWVSLTSGIARFDIRRRLFQRFGRTDGVALLTGSRNAFSHSRDGRIYFGGFGGVTWFDPDSVDYAWDVPRTAITQIQVHQQSRFFSATGTSPIVLGPLENTLTFRFAVMDFIDPEQNVCKYMLEGVDVDWIYSDNQRGITYAGLPAGEYRFRVRGANARGIWSTTEATVPLIIRPPYSQAWWFRAILILTLGGALYGLYRYRMSRIVALERVRLRIADDLHDDIGSELSGIALESDLIARQFPAGTPQQTRLLLLGQTVRKVSGDLRDVVWFVNPEFDKLPDLIARMRTVANKMLIGHQLTFDIPADIPPVPLGMEFKRHLLMMFKEMLNNIVRHAKAQNVRILLELDGMHFKLCVQDDGIGFDTNMESTGRGLFSMHSRAEAIGGRFTLERGVNSGTTVCIEGDIIRSGD